MSYVVAVIPARKGSKRLPGKNILPVDGKPMIAYTIEVVLECGVADRVIVSTDDEEIAKIAKKYGAEVPFIRPKHLATDTAHTPPVVEHAVDFIEKQENIKVDVVLTLQPNCPLLKALHIKRAMKKFLQGTVDSLISVKRSFPPEWLFIRMNERFVPLIQFKYGRNPFNLESQELSPAYQSNGAIYITDRNYLKKEVSIINPDGCNVLIMDDEDSYDIDTKIDLLVVENIIKDRKEEVMMLMR